MGKRGPKPRIENPYPSKADVPDAFDLPDGRIEWLTPEQQASLEASWRERVRSLDRGDLDLAERALRQSYGVRRVELRVQSGETLEQAVRRIKELVEKALEENAIDLLWSGLRKETFIEVVPDARDTGAARVKQDGGRTSADLPSESREHVVLPREPIPSRRVAARRYGWQDMHIGPTPPKRPRDGCLWVDTSVTPRVVRNYDKKAKSWSGGFLQDPNGVVDYEFLYSFSRPTAVRLVTRWQMFKIQEALDGSIRRMLAGEDLGRAGKSGRPAYLAYATLAAMLGVTPQKINDFLANYRRRKKASASRSQVS